MDKRLRVLISAYACEPGKGSEPGIGWNVAREMAKWHDVWVLTRANNRPAIESELATNPVAGLTFAYYDLPAWLRWWKRGAHGVQLYYYLWQIGAIAVARNLHRTVNFNLAHHVTFVKHWAPSLLAFVPIRFIWGPVGGGESTPPAFRHDLSARGRRYERFRDVARWLGEHDPLVRLTARRSTVALATTEETAERLRRLGCEVRLLPGVAIAQEELALAREHPTMNPIAVFLSIGRLLHWKGFHLGLRAFALAAVPGAEYWIIGEGPERGRLEALATSLGVAERVRFLGQIPREQVLAHLEDCTALVHPSLHDSGGWVSLEAMAAGKPVICLDVGGPSVQVTHETGFKVPAKTPDQAVKELADAMLRLANEPDLRSKMGATGRRRVQEVFTWERKAEAFDELYTSVLGERSEVS